MRDPDEAHGTEPETARPTDEVETGRDEAEPPSLDASSLESLAAGFLNAASLEQLGQLWPRSDGSDGEREPDADRSGANGESAKVLERLEELADDMLTLMRRLRELEAGQQKLLERLDQFVEQQAASQRNTAREVDTLRRDLIGERRHLATTELIQELMPLIERMSAMRDHLDPERDERMRTQLGGVVDALGAGLRRLGGQEFFVDSGTAFDQFQMDTFDQWVGPDSVVEVTLKPGMRVGQIVLRRALVKLAAKKATNEAGDSVHE
jgi:molecular chaperone GrpE (heat shock protein)